MDEKEYSSQKSFSIVRLLGGLYLLYLCYCIISEGALEPPLRFLAAGLIGLVGIFFIVSAYRSFVTVQNKKREAERNQLTQRETEEDSEEYAHEDEQQDTDGEEPSERM